MAKKSGFFAGVIFGALAGAAGALLTSPKKGEELRNDLKLQYDEYKENPQEKMAEYKELAQDKALEARDYTTEKIDEFKEKVDNGDFSVEKVTDYLNEKKQAAADKIANAKEDMEESDDELLPENLDDFEIHLNPSQSEDNDEKK